MAQREWEYFTDISGGRHGLHVDRHLMNLYTELEEKAQGKRVRVRIRINVVRARRSIPQNRYYWAVVCNLCAKGMTMQWGRPVSAEEAHEVLKRECNGRDIINRNTGEIVRSGQSTAELTKGEWEEYMDRCRVWIHDWFEIIVPLPNEQLAADLSFGCE